MRQSQMKPMVESGILSAVAIIFALIGVYLPVFGQYIIFLWPIPIILLGVRHGSKWSIMATIVSGSIIGMLLGPLSGLGIIGGFGLVGIVLGHALRAGFSPAKTLLLSSAVSLISMVALLMISIWVMGVNPVYLQLDIMGKFYQQLSEQTMEVSRNIGMTEEQLARISESMRAMSDVSLMKLVLPALFVMMAAITSCLNFFVARAVLKKLGHSIVNLPPFKHWMLPKYIVYILVAVLLMTYWGQVIDVPVLKQIGMNLQAIAMIILFVQGLALFYYLAEKYNLSKPARGIILFLVFTNMFFSQMLITAAVWDILLDYRKLDMSSCE